MNDFDGNPGSRFESNVVLLPVRPQLQDHVQWHWHRAVGWTGAVLGGSFLWWMLLRLTGIL